MRTVYTPEEAANAEPFATEKNLVDKLHELAAMEHALALEYLYARYSVITDSSLAKPELLPHAEYVAHELLMIASSEMMHLRWANQLLWELRHNRPGAESEAEPEPELRIAHVVPYGKTVRKVKMRSLTKAIDDFIVAEKNSATLEGQYARVFATLQYDYPPALAELASRIIADGVSHYVRFREIKTILLSHATSGKAPGEALRVPFVREIEPVPLDEPSQEIREYLETFEDLYREIFANLKYAYQTGDPEDRESIADARKAMMRLDDAAVKFSAKYPKVGIPLDEIGRNVAGSYPK
jgi:rubrerythrin